MMDTFVLSSRTRPEEILFFYFHLAEFREVVLLTERTLPQPRGVVTDGLVVAFSLGPPVSDASNYAGNKLT